MEHYRVCFDANDFHPHRQNGVDVITYIIKAILILPKYFFFPSYRPRLSSGTITIVHSQENQYKQPLDKLIIKYWRRHISVKIIRHHLMYYVVVMQHVSAQVAVCIPLCI